jgi:hypothetical protein
MMLKYLVIIWISACQYSNPQTRYIYDSDSLASKLKQKILLFKMEFKIYV